MRSPPARRLRHRVSRDALERGEARRRRHLGCTALATIVAYATPLLRRARRAFLGALGRRQHRARGDDADGRVLLDLGCRRDRPLDARCAHRPPWPVLRRGSCTRSSPFHSARGPDRRRDGHQLPCPGITGYLFIRIYGEHGTPSEDLSTVPGPSLGFLYDIRRNGSEASRRCVCRIGLPDLGRADHGLRHLGRRLQDPGRASASECGRAPARRRYGGHQRLPDPLRHGDPLWGPCRRRRRLSRARLRERRSSPT